MRIDGTNLPTNPYHIARAYGTSAISPVRPAMMPARVTPVAPAAPEQPQEMREAIRQLVAAQVPGRVDFSGEDGPRQTSGALSFYRHPADRNAAAVGVSVGRALDVRG